MLFALIWWVALILIWRKLGRRAAFIYFAFPWVAVGAFYICMESFFVGVILCILWIVFLARRRSSYLYSLGIIPVALGAAFPVWINLFMS